MTKQTEAMLLALDALDRARNTAMIFALKARIPECGEFAGIAQDLDWAVTVIREALAEQPAQQEPYCWMSPEGTIYQASDEDVLKGSIPMYLGKPPAQRKPLTDKEIDSFREANSEGRGAGWRFNFKGFARAIEAAHNIKGEA